MKKSMEKREQRKNPKILNIFSGIIVGMFIYMTVYLIINISKLANVENTFRYILIGVLSLMCLIVLLRYLRFRKKGKISKYLLFIAVLLIIGTGEYMISSIINKGVSVIDNINKDEITYTSALVALKDGNYTNIKDIDDAKIAIISNEDDTEGYVLAQKIIEDNKISEDNLVQYDDYITMLTDLYNSSVDAAFITGSYVDKFSKMDGFDDIKDKLVVLDKYSKVMKKVVDEQTQASTKSVTEPFTMLLLGVDSETEDISKTSGLGDSIMLITFNPNTLNATIFSIPRDTYVPITCFGNYKNKITHAASGGDSCMISTIENFTGIDIDYYAKINFRGLIKLVDALGGIDVDVPYAFCESDENRTYEGMLYVEKGLQHLNGRQALALSRNRKTIEDCGPHWNHGERNDFVRGQNQQLVVKGIINKAKSIKSVNKLYEILDTISISLDTNLSRNQILDFYNVFKKILLNSGSLSNSNDIINIQKTYLNGSSAMIYDERSGLVLYNFVPSSASLNAIVEAMEINLGLKDEKFDTSFSFSIDEPYEDIIIGSDEYGGSSVSILPDFTGMTRDYVSSYCISRGIKVTFKEKDVSSSSGYKQDQVISQSLPASYSIADIKDALVVTVANIKDKNNSKCEDENMELGEDGVACVCKFGYEENKETGMCEKKESPTCGENQELDSTGTVCRCIDGYVEQSDGSCIEDITPDPEESETAE